MLHGIDSFAGAHWQGWLAEELHALGHQVFMPELPEPARPDRGRWLETVNDVLGDTDSGSDNLVIVGHSLGVTTGLDYVEHLGSPVKIFLSVAGFGRDYGSDLNSYFLKARDVDFEKVRRNIEIAHVLHGDDDPWVFQSALKQLATDLGAESTVVVGGGHLNTASGFTTFPLLLATIIDDLQVP